MSRSVTVVLSALVGFWLVGMVGLRSELWLPWLSLLIAIGLSLWLMLRRGD